MTRSSVELPGGEHTGAPWIASRTRNAIRRWLLVLSTGATTFVVALVALVLVPRQASRSARIMMPAEGARPDTGRPAIALVRARLAFAAADSALAAARDAARRAPVAASPVDTFPPELVARRDSLTVAIGSLNRLLARAENAPLPASYRALGESREMRYVPRVRALLDSLADIEREREAFGAVNGVDPIFVALTARVTEVGRAIQDLAQERRAALRRELAPLRPTPPQPPPAIPASTAVSTTDSLQRDSTASVRQQIAPLPPLATIPDTVVRAARADSARRSLARAEQQFAEAQRRNAEFERRVERARELANVAAPPVALLAAALVLGAVTGFIVSLLVEMRHPRVADVREAERLAGARVIATIRPHPPTPERGRRRADRETSPLIDTGAEGYRMLYLHVSATGSAIPLITATGDDANIVATVAANLAAASAYEARTTLLVDADLGAGAVSGVLRLPPEPGLATVINERADWAEVVQLAVVGRDRTLDVIPSGVWATGRVVSPEAAERVRRDLTRVACRYDFAVLVADEAHAERGATSMVPGPDVIIVARVGYTPLSWLASAVEGLGRAGTRVRGVVLWDTEPPQIPTRDEIAATVGRRRRRGALPAETAST
ncbi:MAG: hypothetical protein ACJ79S_20755 [Gemmatimonadaceae bacterium]